MESTKFDEETKAELKLWARDAVVFVFTLLVAAYTVAKVLV